MNKIKQLSKLASYKYYLKAYYEMIKSNIYYEGYFKGSIISIFEILWSFIIVSVLQYVSKPFMS